MNSTFFLIFLATIQFLIDLNQFPCNSLCGLSLLSIHHILDIYIYFGGYFTNPSYHLLTIILLLIHWRTNNDKCFLTQWVNSVCYPEYIEYKRFNDFSNMLGLQDNYPNIHNHYVIFMIWYDLTRIYFDL